MRCRGCGEQYAACMLGLGCVKAPGQEQGYCAACVEAEAWKPVWLKQLERGEKVQVGGF